MECKCKPNRFETIVYANYENIDTWVELVRLNKLFEKYREVENFRKFIVIKIASIKKCYVSTFVFSSSKKIWQHLLKKQKQPKNNFFTLWSQKSLFSE